MKTFNELGKALLHIGPLSTMVLISTITLAMLYCSMMYWPPYRSIGGLLSISFFSLCSGLTMYHFLCSIYEGPGFLPLNWKPNDEADCSKLQFCTHCNGYKAPRAHHCRKCNRCVMKMDHHCPWINECVGHQNHAHFISFLVSAAVGCSYATIILGFSIYHAAYRGYYIYFRMFNEPLVYLGFYGFLWCLFSLGCAFGVSVGVSALFYYQAKIVHRNQTSIEDWIVEKAEYRRRIDPELPPFVYPYDFGWKRNWSLVINWACEPEGDGIYWPVIEGCDQYTLTEEQLNQKRDKKDRSKVYKIIDNYNGSWFPLNKGFGALFRPPCTDESRIPVNQGDMVRVSRWKKYWLYGELIRTPAETDGAAGDPGVNATAPKEVKGWIPRSCAVDINLRHKPDCIHSKEFSDADISQSSQSEDGQNKKEN